MELTLKSSTDKICNSFKQVLNNGGTWNLKTKNGFHFLVGGKDPIYSKIENDQQYIEVNGKWVLV